MSLDELYQELILDHYKHPRCQGCIANPDAKIGLRNPLCGDEIELTLKVEGDKISDIAFSGQGCSISQATASIMTSTLKGKSVSEAKEMAKLFRQMMRGEVHSEELVQLGDAVALEGVRRYTARIKCALLAWDCIERALEQKPAQSH